MIEYRMANNRIIQLSYDKLIISTPFGFIEISQNSYNHLLNLVSQQKLNDIQKRQLLENGVIEYDLEMQLFNQRMNRNIKVYDFKKNIIKHLNLKAPVGLTNNAFFLLICSCSNIEFIKERQLFSLKQILKYDCYYQIFITGKKYFKYSDFIVNKSKLMVIADKNITKTQLSYSNIFFINHISMYEKLLRAEYYGLYSYPDECQNCNYLYFCKAHIKMKEKCCNSYKKYINNILSGGTE